MVLNDYKTIWSYGPREVKVSSPAKKTMQPLMWQRDVVGVAHFIVNWASALGALSDAAAHAFCTIFSSPWRLDRCHSCPQHWRKSTTFGCSLMTAGAGLPARSH